MSNIFIVSIWVTACCVLPVVIGIAVSTNDPIIVVAGIILLIGATGFITSFRKREAAPIAAPQPVPAQTPNAGPSVSGQTPAQFAAGVREALIHLDTIDMLSKSQVSPLPLVSSVHCEELWEDRGHLMEFSCPHFAQRNYLELRDRIAELTTAAYEYGYRDVVWVWPNGKVFMGFDDPETAMMMKLAFYDT